MIAKKNKKANLERKRFAFFQIGLLVSGSLCLAAFEWSSAVPDEHTEVLEPEIYSFQGEPALDDEVIIVRQVQQKAAVNLENMEDIKVVKKKQVEGDPLITNKKDVVFIPGDWDGGDPDLTIYEDGDGEILEYAEVEPQFPGGEAAMMEWLGNEIEFPQLPAEMGLGGVTYVQFVVNTNGSIVDVKCVGTEHEDFGKEGIRVVRKMPKWIPGEQAGKKVRVRYTLPINFINPR